MEQYFCICCYGRLFKKGEVRNYTHVKVNIVLSGENSKFLMRQPSAQLRSSFRVCHESSDCDFFHKSLTLSFLSYTVAGSAHELRIT